MAYELLVTDIVAGLVGSTALALTSYSKARKPDGTLESFDTKKFAVSVLLGGAVGGISSLGITVTPEITAFISASIAAGIENVYKAVKRLPYFNK